MEITEDVGSVNVNVTLAGHDFIQGEKVTVKVLNGTDVVFTENGTQPSTLTITATPDSIKEANTVTDITATVTSSAGEIEKSVVTSGTLTVIDTIDTVYARIVNNDMDVEGNALTHTVELYTIDDVTGERVAYVVPEGETVTLNITYNPSNTDTASTPADYTKALTVDISGGQSQAQVAINTIDDTTQEGYEYYTAKITGATSTAGQFENIIISPDSVKGTIVDNDSDNLFGKLVINEIGLEPSSTKPAFIEIMSIAESANYSTGKTMMTLGLEIVGKDGQVLVINPGFIDNTVPAKGFLVIYENGSWSTFKSNGDPSKTGTWTGTVYDGIIQNGKDGVTYNPLTHNFNFGNTTAAPLSVNLLQFNGTVTDSNSKDIEKIPLLGDIPIIGMLFTSKAFRQGQSELVFFITPEIVDSRNNNQIDELQQRAQFNKTLENPVVIEEKDRAIKEEKEKKELERKKQEEKFKEILGN